MVPVRFVQGLLGQDAVISLSGGSHLDITLIGLRANDDQTQPNLRYLSLPLSCDSQGLRGTVSHV